tara:strand:+ start:240 stop:941 length:702 start_codon:yes stop_codon:yes gene_type:complete
MNIVVGNKYRLVNRVGRGKFGHVFSCVNLVTNDLCAVKIEDSAAGILKKEAKIYRLLKGVKGVLKLYDYGREGKFTYLVISLISNPIASQQIPALCRLLPGLIDTLRMIHESGVIHCDLKPGNIVFTNNTAYIIDFGLSRYGSPLSESLSEVVGSSAYCSDNVLNLKPPHEADDVISLVLSIAAFAGDYSYPFIRRDLPQEYQDLIKELPSLETRNLYRYTLNKLMTIIRKQG